MKHIIALSVVTMLWGCSSAPQHSKLVSNQYCHTKQTIQTENNNSVSSRTLVECSDDPTDKYVPAKTGLGKDCIVSYIQMPYGREKIYACKKYDGKYDIIDSRSIR